MLLFVIALQTFSKAFIVVNYHLNKAEITRKFCENKSKPKMHCDGKCHLKKQLKKEEKKEHSPFSRDLKEKHESQYFVEHYFTFLPQITQGSSIQTIYSFSVSTSLLQGIFHPPTC